MVNGIALTEVETPKIFLVLIKGDVNLFSASTSTSDMFDVLRWSRGRGKAGSHQEPSLAIFNSLVCIIHGAKE